MQARKKHFTLMELLISLSLLVVISVVVLRMLTMTGEYWHYSHEQSDVYLDGKVVFNMLGEELNEFNTDEETEKLAASELEERAYFFIKYNIMRPTNPNWTPDELQERVKAWIERKGNVEGVTKVREEAFYRYIAKLKKA